MLPFSFPSFKPFFFLSWNIHSGFFIKITINFNFSVFLSCFQHTHNLNLFQTATSCRVAGGSKTKNSRQLLLTQVYLQLHSIKVKSKLETNDKNLWDNQKTMNLKGLIGKKVPAAVHMHSDKRSSFVNWCSSTDFTESGQIPAAEREGWLAMAGSLHAEPVSSASQSLPP